MSHKHFSDLPNRPKSFEPHYQDNHNFQTNAKSYFHYLGKSNKFLEIMAERIEEYDETLDNSLENLHNILNDYSDQWDENLETINDDVVAMMVEWMEDGTLAEIINEEIFSWKADTEWVQLQLEEKANITDMITLFEEMEEKTKTVRKISSYGADPTGETDSTEAFIQAFKDMESGDVLELDHEGYYITREQLELHKSGLFEIDGKGSTIETHNTKTSELNGIGLSLEGIPVKTIVPHSSIKEGSKKIFCETNDLEVGMLVHVNSDHQYNTARDYYKRGGTFSIQKVENDGIVISGFFPYDINLSNDLRLEIYNPITVDIHDLNVYRGGDIHQGRFGIHLKNSLDSSIKRVSVKNYDHNYHLRTVENTFLHQIHSLENDGENRTGERYGLTTYSSTRLFILQSKFNTGGVGVDLSGFTNSFQTTIDSCAIQSEVGKRGLNMHESSYNAEIRNSYIESFGATGHTLFSNCTIVNSTQNNLKAQNTYRRSRITFRDCDFISDGTMGMTLENWAQTDTSTNNYMGSLKLIDCSTAGIKGGPLTLDLGISGESFRIDEISIENTNNVYVKLNDSTRVNILRFENYVQNGYTLVLSSTENNYISDLQFINCIFPKGYYPIIVEQFNNVLFNNCRFQDFETIDAEDNVLITISNKGNDYGTLTLLNTDFSMVSLETVKIEKMVLINSELPIDIYESTIATKLRTTMEEF